MTIYGCIVFGADAKMYMKTYETTYAHTKTYVKTYTITLWWAHGLSYF